MDSIKVTGKLKVTLTGEDGSTVNHYYNNVMTNGKIIIAKFLVGQKPDAPSMMAIGTDNTAVDPSQTALFSEVYRKQLMSSINDGNKAIMDCVYGYGEAVGQLTEAGLFFPDGTMFARALINEDKGIYQNLTISWEITIS